MAYRNIAEMFFDRAAVRGLKPCFRVKRDGAWTDTSWEVTADLIRETAAGLVDLGVEPGDKVAILSSTRPEWVESDLAIYACGGVAVPIYQSNLPHECGYILSNSESRVCFVENAKQLEKIRAVQREGFELDGSQCSVEVDHLILMDGEPDGPDVVTLGALRERGRAGRERLNEKMRMRLASVGRDDLATIVYTSGTTGPPKGVMQTHGNHLASVEAVGTVDLAREDEVAFLFLPLAHSFARMLEYYGLWAGTVTAFATSVDAVAQEIAEVKPHLIPSVPRIFEKIYARIMSTRDAANAIRQTLFDWAIGVGRERSLAEQERQPVPILVQAQALVADTLVLSASARCWAVGSA